MFSSDKGSNIEDLDVLQSGQWNPFTLIGQDYQIVFVDTEDVGYFGSENVWMDNYNLAFKSGYDSINPNVLIDHIQVAGDLPHYINVLDDTPTFSVILPEGNYNYDQGPGITFPEVAEARVFGEAVDTDSNGLMDQYNFEVKVLNPDLYGDNWVAEIYNIPGQYLESVDLTQVPGTDKFIGKYVFPFEVPLNGVDDLDTLALIGTKQTFAGFDTLTQHTATELSYPWPFLYHTQGEISRSGVNPMNSPESDVWWSFARAADENNAILRMDTYDERLNLLYYDPVADDGIKEWIPVRGPNSMPEWMKGEIWPGGALPRLIHWPYLKDN